MLSSVTLNVPAETADELRRVAHAARRTVSAVIREAIAAHLKIEVRPMRRRSSRSWSPEERKKIRDMRIQGYGQKTIAHEMKCGLAALRTVLVEEGLSVKFKGVSWTPAEDERLRGYRANGVSWRLISKLMGKSTTNVRNRAAKLGV